MPASLRSEGEAVPDFEAGRLSGSWYRFVGADGADDEWNETEVRRGVQGTGCLGGGTGGCDGGGTGGPSRRSSQSDLRLEEATSGRRRADPPSTVALSVAAPYNTHRNLTSFFSGLIGMTKTRWIAPLVVAILLVSAICRAEDWYFHELGVGIPSPVGFSAVTSDMSNVQAFLAPFVPASNEELISFIPESAVPVARQGQIPDLTRRFSVQMPKKHDQQSVSLAEFQAFKDLVRSKNAEFIRRFENQYPQILAELRDTTVMPKNAISSIHIDQAIPLPVHKEGNDVISYSLLLRYRIYTPHDSASYISVASSAYVRVKGRLLFLYCFADKDDLEWSRQSLDNWADSILGSNRQLSSRVSQPDMPDLDIDSMVRDFAVTWTIGLIPPLLIRYRVIKKPMKKAPALGTCFAFYIFNVILFTAAGSQSKSHLALGLVAIISYWILRRVPRISGTNRADASS